MVNLYGISQERCDRLVRSVLVLDLVVLWRMVPLRGWTVWLGPMGTWFPRIVMSRVIDMDRDTSMGTDTDIIIIDLVSLGVVSCWEKQSVGRY